MFCLQPFCFLKWYFGMDRTLTKSSSSMQRSLVTKDPAVEELSRFQFNGGNSWRSLPEVAEVTCDIIGSFVKREFFVERLVTVSSFLQRGPTTVPDIASSIADVRDVSSGTFSIDEVSSASSSSSGNSLEWSGFAVLTRAALDSLAKSPSFSRDQISVPPLSNELLQRFKQFKTDGLMAWRLIGGNVSKSTLMSLPPWWSLLMSTMDGAFAWIHEMTQICWTPKVSGPCHGMLPLSEQVRDEIWRRISRFHLACLTHPPGVFSAQQSLRMMQGLHETSPWSPFFQSAPAQPDKAPWVGLDILDDWQGKPLSGPHVCLF